MKKQQYLPPRLGLNEKGLVSILVTVVLMLIMTIITLSFSQVIRREQRQALDRQLSTQAFYAAESGVNAARSVIGKILPATPPDKTECGIAGAPGEYLDLTGEVDTATETTYSCLLISPAPQTLAYDLSPSLPAKVFPINVDSASNPIDSLQIQWTPDSGGGTYAACTNSSNPVELYPAAAWGCQYGLVRMDLSPVDGPISRDSLLKETFTGFFTPTRNGGVSSTVTYNSSNVNGGSANQGPLVATKCDATNCTATITNLSGRKYFARVSIKYRSTQLKISARDSLGNELKLTGAQILIDSTGRASDVLRRIQVRIPLVHDGLQGDFAIQSTDSMCKVFSTFSNGGEVYSNHSGDSSPYCAPTTP
jgi:Tfp pilus assembly protein PilX